MEKCLLIGSFLFEYSVVGVLKSILQIFFGMFAFDRLAINDKTIFGIILSLIGGTIFSYLEYTNKQTRLTSNTIDNIAEQEITPMFDVEKMTINDEKFVSIFNNYYIICLFLGRLLGPSNETVYR